MKIKFASSPRSPKGEKNVFYSFSISHFVLDLFKFVWYVNETTSDVKLCPDHLKLLENHAYL